MPVLRVQRDYHQGPRRGPAVPRERLKREIEHVAKYVARPRRVVQFHWGGGTPTYLTPEQMEDLFGFAAEKFTFAPDAEIGIEVDPRVTSLRHLESLRRLGFNRLSLGIQDFDPEVQQAIHRVQPREMTAELIAQARALGFGSVNVDLIYGLALPDGAAVWANRRTGAGARAGPRGDVQLRARAVAAETARRFGQRICRKAWRNFAFSGRGSSAFWGPGINISAWTTSRGRMTNWP